MSNKTTTLAMGTEELKWYKDLNRFVVYAKSTNEDEVYKDVPHSFQFRQDVELPYILHLAQQFVDEMGEICFNDDSQFDDYAGVYSINVTVSGGRQSFDFATAVMKDTYLARRCYFITEKIDPAFQNCYCAVISMENESEDGCDIPTVISVEEVYTEARGFIWDRTPEGRLYWEKEVKEGNDINFLISFYLRLLEVDMECYGTEEITPYVPKFEIIWESMKKVEQEINTFLANM